MSCSAICRRVCSAGAWRSMPTAAARAIDSNVARPLGLGREEAARGMLAILDNNMMGALRIVSVERGHDPRDFTLVPFGGAGPLHGCALAELLGIRRVLVPPAPGVLCADGLLAADLKADFSRTLPRTGKVDIETARAIYAELSRQADDWLAKENVAPADRTQARVALMRYHGQGGEVSVGWVDDAAGVEAAFAAAHESLYGFKLDSPIELVTLRIEATGRMPAPQRPVLARRHRIEAARTPHRPFRLGNDRGAAVRSRHFRCWRPPGRSGHHHPARRHDSRGARLVRRGSAVGRDPAHALLALAGPLGARHPWRSSHALSERRHLAGSVMMPVDDGPSLTLE